MRGVPYGVAARHAARKQCPRGHWLVAPNLVASMLTNHGKRACLVCSRARANLGSDRTDPRRLAAEIESQLSRVDGDRRDVSRAARYGETHWLV